MYPEVRRERLTLLDLVLAVQDETNDDREALAALMHLLDPVAVGGAAPSPRQENPLKGL